MSLHSEIRIVRSAIRMAFNQDIKAVSPEASVDGRFLHYAMLARVPDLRDAVEAAGHGTGVLPTDRLSELPIPALPLPEQRAIAATLGALDDKIELNRKMNATLEAMARALFRDWFTGFGPTRAKMAGRPPYLSPDLWPLFPARLDADGKPEGWEVSTIGDEVRVVGGSTPSTKEPDLWDGGINWATPKDLSTLAAPVLLETARTISTAGLAKISSGLLPVGSLLLSSRAPIGYLAIAEVPVAINQGFIGMICDKRLSNVFAWLWTLENMDAILAKANGSTFQEISKGNFRPLPVVVAPDPVLKAFDAIAKPLYDRIARNERESRTLAQTRDLLLPRLMSGEIRVRDAERLVEEAG
jgi:type I restriction enzyme S subunit